jgi:hypothetical protein
MKKLFTLLAIIALALVAGPAQAAYYKYHATIEDEAGNAITSGVQIHVFTADSKTLATIASDKAGTSKTNPISTTQFATDGEMVFFTTTTTVDLLVSDTQGNQAFIEDFGYQDRHTIVLPKERSTAKTLIVPFAAQTNCDKVNSGFTLPSNYAVENVLLEVVTNQASKNLHVGIYGDDTDGFLAGATLDTAGFPAMAGSNLTQYGAYLVGADQSGSNMKIPKAVKLGDTNEISYEFSQAGGSSASGYIHFLLRRLR